MSAALCLILYTVALASAGSFRKQKPTSTLTTIVMKNSTLARDIYLTQQHMVHGTR